MAGYTPLFSSLTTGTLYGRWPDIGLWPIVLSLADKNGIVDVMPQYLSGVTGLQLEAIIACMARFCEPDPRSRSKAESGARLVLIDADRDWGWRVVNHTHYREKARKQMQQVEATESGRDAERKRVARERAASSDVHPRPAKSGADRPSDADADADKNSEVLSGSVLHPHVSGSSPALKPQERFIKSAGEGRAQVQALARSLAQSKKLSK